MLARTQSRFHDVRIRLENYVPRTAAGRLSWEFFLFGFKQGWACLFGGILLVLLLLTKWFWPAGMPLARYDFLFLAALAIQAMLLLLRMETIREAQIIFVFHVIGTVMELFKTNIGSWIYPKYGSWFLLMIISFILVSVVNPPLAPASEAEGSVTPLGAARAERRSLP